MNDASASSSSSRIATSAPARARRHPRATLLLLGVLVAFALFAGAELSLRALHVGERRELLEFSSPGGPVLTREPSWPTLSTDASLSLDRIAAPRAKTAGRFRIVVVGESTAAGFPFYPQLSFARLLEASLKDELPALDVEVVNFGHAADPSDAVRTTAIEALALEPDLLVVCSGHNEYQASYVEDLRDGPWPRLRSWLRELRLVELGASRVVSADAPKPELPESRRIGDRPWLTESELERGTARLHANLSAIVDAAEKRAVDVILMTQASNLRDFAPCYSSFTRKLSDGEKAEYERLLRELETEAAATVIPADAERTVARLRDLDPGVALATWLVARLNERAGRPADAAALYALALDQDGYPNRARGALNVAIRQLAFERKVPLADAQASFALATRNPVPGSDLFLDYCHPTIEGMAQLADCVRPLVLERLYRRGAAVPGRFVDRPMLARAPIEDWLARLKLSREQLVGGVVRAGQGSLLIWLGLPANHEALVLARRAFEQALRTAPENLDAEQGLLVVEIAEGNRAAALDRAGRLAARSAASLQKVDDACKQSPPLREKLDAMGLQFRDGRLVAR